MELTKFIVIFAALTAKVFLAEIIIQTSQPDKLRLIEITIDVLKSCHLNQLSTVGLVGASAESIINRLWLSDFVTPVILIDDSSRILNKDSVTPISRYKLQIFVVTVTNSSSLVKTLIQIKNSIWWNHMATFLLLDWHISNHGCSNVYEVLWEAWKMNLLSSNFMCLHETKGSLIYTYNPYMSTAPLPWQLENIYKRNSDHIWTLLVQVYRNDEKNCNALNFDKTTDLGGYEIHSSVHGSREWYEKPSMKANIYNKVTYMMAKVLIDSLNATWKLRIHPTNYSLPGDEQENRIDDISEVADGISDISFALRNKVSWINYTTTTFVVISSLRVITQYSGHVSQLGKIISVLDSNTRFGLLLIYVITLLFFKYHLRKPLVTTILYLVILTCNAALPKIPKKLASRIFLGSLFFFVLTIQGIYQGKLASLLANKVNLPNANNIQDLARFGYTIYGHKIYYYNFDDSAFEGRYIGLNTLSCTHYVLRDSKAACASLFPLIIPVAAKFKLHLMHDEISTLYGVYIIRSDWPLEKRVNRIYERCFEGHLVLPLIAGEMANGMSIIKSYETEDNDKQFKVLMLRELCFVFIILGIGLGCAVISFIIEIRTNRSRVVNIRSRIRGQAILVE